MTNVLNNLEQNIESDMAHKENLKKERLKEFMKRQKFKKVKKMEESTDRVGDIAL